MKYPIIMLCFFSFACQQRIEYPKGGFDYPKYVDDKDTNFYCYPLKDIEPKKDSFYDAFTYRYLKRFDENNLSLRPMEKDIFRFRFGTALGEYSYIITLQEYKLIIKKGSISKMFAYNEMEMTEKEQLYLRLFRSYFPVKETIIKKPKYKRYLDSLLHKYPLLLDVNYFNELETKAYPVNDKPFIYDKKIVTLTKEKFLAIINEINNSGYWKLPYHVEYGGCMDGFGFTLEANTATKYKIVSASSCNGDTSKFSKACQKLIDYAGLEKEVQVYYSPNISDTSKSRLVIQDVQLESIQPYKKRNRRK